MGNCNKPDEQSVVAPSSLKKLPRRLPLVIAKKRYVAPPSPSLWIFQLLGNHGEIIEKS